MQLQSEFSLIRMGVESFRTSLWCVAKLLLFSKKTCRVNCIQNQWEPSVKKRMVLEFVEFFWSVIKAETLVKPIFWEGCTLYITNSNLGFRFFGSFIWFKATEIVGSRVIGTTERINAYKSLLRYWGGFSQVTVISIKPLIPVGSVLMCAVSFFSFIKHDSSKLFDNICMKQK